jgi:starch synthase
MERNLRVLFLAAEAEPFVKIGGLGDVAGALPPALLSLPDHPDVRLVIPLHKQINQKTYKLKPVAAFEVEHAGGPIQAEVFKTNLNNLTVYLINGAPFEEAEFVYTSDTLADGYKYTFFSLAALELCRTIDWQPDIVHAHDWHTAASVYALKTNYRKDPFYQATSTLLTIHNLPYLGNGAGPALKNFGIPKASKSALPWWAQDMPLPLGLLTADKINTVSKGYAQEMLTPDFGSGLEEFLQTRQSDLIGILNGLDLDNWNPETDPYLRENFNTESLGRRAKNKTTLQNELGLSTNRDLPLLAFIGRMDHQKGVDIALEALRNIADLEWQAVILGTGDPNIEISANQLADEMPDRVRALIRFDSTLARKIYAGADIMMIPSRYEPCGLIQMISMRYGCIPVARSTGGLKDTILDYGSHRAGTGFLFPQANPDSMANALRRACTTYSDKRRWPYLQKRGMQKNFSWKKSALQYQNLYQMLINHKHSNININH